MGSNYMLANLISSVSKRYIQICIQSPGIKGVRRECTLDWAPSYRALCSFTPKDDLA